MKILTKFSLTLFSVGLLAACGSSGGGGGDHSPSTGTQTTSANQPVNLPSTGGSVNRNPTNDDDMGEAYRISDGQDFDIAKATNYQTELVVDGKKLSITPGYGISAGRLMNLSGSTVNGVKYDQFAVSGHRYSDVKFGAVNGYVFAQGNVTADSAIPTTGSAVYNVDGILVQNGAVQISDSDVETLSLTADFANKTLNGNVFHGVSVTNAKIDGNDFSGKAVYSGVSADLEGHFYGTNADEIGGAYGSPSFSGAFGGKKQ